MDYFSWVFFKGLQLILFYNQPTGKYNFKNIFYQ